MRTLILVTTLAALLGATIPAPVAAGKVGAAHVLQRYDCWLRAKPAQRNDNGGVTTIGLTAKWGCHVPRVVIVQKAVLVEHREGRRDRIVERFAFQHGGGFKPKVGRTYTLSSARDFDCIDFGKVMYGRFTIQLAGKHQRRVLKVVTKRFRGGPCTTVSST